MILFAYRTASGRASVGAWFYLYQR